MDGFQLRDAIRVLTAQIAKRSTSALVDGWAKEVELLADQIPAIAPVVVERRSGIERRQGKDVMNPGRRGGPRRGVRQVIPDTPVVGSVTVTSQAPASMEPTDTYQLTVQVLSTEGAILTGRTVTYTSTVELDATVSAGGLVTAVSDGSSVVKAHCEGVSSAGQTITVTTPQGPLASVTVTPASGSLGVTQTQQVQAVPRDASANFLPGLTVTWGTSSGAIATVSADSGDDNHTATVTAVAAGVATITATCGAFTDTYVATVTAAGAFAWMTPINPLPTGLTFNEDTGLITGTVYDATWDVSGATVVNVSTTAQLNTEIIAASSRAGKTHIKMALGTYTPTSPILLRVRTQAGATYISCPDTSLLPSQTAGNVVGKAVNRVNPTDHAAVMPTLTCLTGNQPFFEEVDGCTDYHFRGLNFTNPSNLTLSDGWFDLSPAVQTTLSNYADKISIQQCLFNGGTGNILRAINGFGRRIAVFDCYATSLGSTAGDCQFFWSSAGPGPYRIVNNYLSVGGTSENIMFGGSPLVGSDDTFLPQDIEVRGNVLTKPLTGFGGSGGSHKNHFEIKYARRFLFEGNVCKVHNRGGQDRSIVIKLTAQGTSGSVEVQTKHGLIRLNDISDSPGGIGISGEEDNPPGTHKTEGIEVACNLVADLNATGGASGGVASRFAGLLLDIDCHHNTLLGYSGNSFANALAFNSAADEILDMTCRYNVMAGSDSIPLRCVRSLNSLGNGETAFAAHTAGTSVFEDNLCVAPTGTEYDDQVRVAAIANLGFVNMAGGDYSLSASSLGYHAGPSGEDYGCPITLLNTVLSGVE